MLRSAVFILFYTALLVNTTAQPRIWSLEECITHAIENNIQIKQQVVQTGYQENALTLSRMRQLPTLNGQASHNYSFGRALDETTYQFTENETVRSNQFYAGSSLTLYGGMQNRNNVIKSRYELTASEYDLERIKDNIALNVAMAYLQILLTKELIIATENQLEVTRQQAERTSRLVSAGSLAKGVLLDIEAQAAREELQLVNLQNQLDISVLNLTQILELESPDNFDIVDPDIDIIPVTGNESETDELYSQALAMRPEIKAAETRVEISETDIKISRGSMHPRLTLNTSFSTGYSDIRRKLLGIDPILGPQYGDYPFFDQLSDNVNYGLGVTLSVPIFNNMQARTSLNNSRLMAQNSRYQLENARKQLYKDIQQARIDAAAAVKKYNASSKSVEASQESFRYAEQRLEVGLVTTVEYNAAKTQLLNAESDLLQARYEFIFKMKVLDFYQGVPIRL